MAANDYGALLDACVRLGDASKGGDPQLWSEVLEFFGAQPWDCSQQVLLCTLLYPHSFPCPSYSR